MRNNWRQYQQESADLFKRHARPHIQDHLGCVCLDVELSDSPLDVNCGIDYLLLHPDSGCLGLAVRMVQHNNFENFALKLHELAYMKLANQHDYICPHYIAQGFVVAGEMKSLGLMKTTDLLQQIAEQKNMPIVWTAQRDKRLMLIDWSKLTDVTIWRTNAEGIFTYCDKEQKSSIEAAESGKDTSTGV